VICVQLTPIKWWKNIWNTWTTVQELQLARELSSRTSWYMKHCKINCTQPITSTSWLAEN
jgi:hypothetical protein